MAARGGEGKKRMIEIAATNIVASQVPKFPPTSMASPCHKIEYAKGVGHFVFLGLNFCPILWALTGVRIVYKASYLGLRKNAVATIFLECWPLTLP